MLRMLKQLKITQRGCLQDLETVLLACTASKSISDSEFALSSSCCCWCRCWCCHTFQPFASSEHVSLSSNRFVSGSACISATRPMEQETGVLDVQLNQSAANGWRCPYKTDQNRCGNDSCILLILSHEELRQLHGPITSQPSTQQDVFDEVAGNNVTMEHITPS